MEDKNKSGSKLLGHFSFLIEKHIRILIVNLLFLVQRNFLAPV